MIDDEHALVDAHIPLGFAEDKRDEVREIKQDHLVGNVYEQGGNKNNDELSVLESGLDPFQGGHWFSERAVGLAQAKQGQVDGNDADHADNDAHVHCADLFEQRRGNQ